MEQNIRPRSFCGILPSVQPVGRLGAGRLHYIGLAAIVLVASAVYLNTLRGGFIFDDHGRIAENAAIRDLSFAKHWFGASFLGVETSHPEAHASTFYRPLTLFSFAVNYRLGGLNPFGYHLVNLALHAGVCVLLFVLPSYCASVSCA